MGLLNRDITFHFNKSSFIKVFHVFEHSILIQSQKNKIIALIRFILAQNYH